MRIVIVNGITIYADGYIPISEENAIQFYREKTVLDYIPPFHLRENNLTDFGRRLLLEADKEDEYGRHERDKRRA